METLTVNAAALRRVLNALNGAGHEIRELQVIRNLPGEKSPIDILIDEFNTAASIAQKSENQQK